MTEGPATTCRRCGVPFSSETVTFCQEDRDLWIYKVDLTEPGVFKSRPGEGNYSFVAMDTFEYYLECRCGERYECDSWDGIHTLQEDE